MGQKVHPTGIRLGIATDWTSKWYAEGKDFASTLATDLKVRSFLRKKLEQASVSRIVGMTTIQCELMQPVWWAFAPVSQMPSSLRLVTCTNKSGSACS